MGCEGAQPLGRQRSDIVPLLRLALLATLWVVPHSLDAQESKASVPNLDSDFWIIWSEPRSKTLPSRGPTKWHGNIFYSGGDDRKPYSETTAQISFTPPNIKTFKITEEHGNAER